MGPQVYLAAPTWPPGRAFSPATRMPARRLPRVLVGEDGRPGHETCAPARTTATTVSSSMPPSTSMSTASPRRSSSARVRATLGITSAMNDWPPNPGKTVMHRIRSTWSRIGLDRLERRVGVGRQPDPQAEGLACASSAAGVAHLDVDGAPVGAGVAERLEEVPGVGHHEVGVEEQPRVLCAATHHRRPDGQVGDEVAVHDVDVEPVGLGATSPTASARLPKSADSTEGAIRSIRAEPTGVAPRPRASRRAAPARRATTPSRHRTLPRRLDLEELEHPVAGARPTVPRSVPGGPAARRRPRRRAGADRATASSTSRRSPRKVVQARSRRTTRSSSGAGRAQSSRSSSGRIFSA